MASERSGSMHRRRPSGQGPRAPIGPAATPRRDEPGPDATTLQRLAATRPTDAPPPDGVHRSGLPGLQRLAGNRAVTSLLTASIQRQPAGAAAAGATAAGAARRSKPAPNAFNSYADLFNAFQELAAAAVNRGGAGLESVRFGRDLNRAHRSLLVRVREVLVQARDPDQEVRRQAAAAWPRLARKLGNAVAEATKVGLPGEALASVTDQIALVGRRYLKTRRSKGEPDIETPADYADTVMGLQELLSVFGRMGEPGPGVLREEVANRKDAVIGMAMLELNAKQRAALDAVKFGGNLNTRHQRLLESLRATLILVRSETAGSAAKATARWRSIQGEVRHVLKRAPNYVDGDIGPIAQSFAATGEVVARHYAAVHGDTVRVALTKERPREQAGTDRAIGEAMGPVVKQAMREARVHEDFGHALTVIEQHLTPSPDHPGEWILTSGNTVIRVRADQVESLRAAAADALKRYMADIVTVMVEAWLTYDSIKRGNSSFKLRVLGGWGGATDPGNQEDVKNSVIHMRDTVVYPLVDQGKFVQAFRTIQGQRGVVEQHAREVGDYDADLDRGYNRLARSMQVIQVALVSLVPVAGEAAIAGGAGIWAVGGTAVAAGSGGAALGETGRQLVFEENLDPGKIGKATYSGAVIGASAVAPAATKRLGNVLAAGEGGTVAVGANALASGTVGAAQSKLGGGDALEGFAGGAVGSLAGSATQGIAPVTQRPVTNTIIQGGVGAGTAAVTGGDPLAGAVGGISGALGTRTAPPTGGGGGGDGTPPAPTPDAGDTLPGTGIAPRTPATQTPTGGRGQTMIGTGIEPRAPAAATAATTPTAPTAGDTLPGTGVTARPPASGVPATSAPPGPATQESIAPVPRPGKAPGGRPGGAQTRRSPFANLPEYASRKPIVGRIAHIIESPEDARALYVRLSNEGQRQILGTADIDIEVQNWVGDGGPGSPPAAWIRAGDGVVRFNFTRFERPNLGGHTSDRPGPVSPPPGRGTPSPPGPAGGSGGGVIRAYARLPEHAGRPPVFGPGTKVGHVITDQQEAQQLWNRLVAERQLNILEHDADFAAIHWSDDGGQGAAPIAWVRAGDGVIRFNLALFQRPPALGGPGNGG